MEWCEIHQNEFPDGEFFTADDGVRMHRSRGRGPHRADSLVERQVPHGEAIDDGRDG